MAVIYRASSTLRSEPPIILNPNVPIMMTAMIIMMILRSFFGMIFNGTAHYSTGRREEEGRKDGLRSQRSVAQIPHPSLRPRTKYLPDVTGISL
jgi:hypothetical protein